MKRIISLIIALMMILFCFSSCSQNGNTPSVSTTTEAPKETETPTDEWFDMVSANGEVCYIVYPKGIDDDLLENFIKKTATKLKTVLGDRLPGVICETEIPSNPGNYIYVGNVDVPESRALLSELKYSDYAYRVYSKSVLCVAGHGEEGLQNALKAFWKTFNSEDIVSSKPLSDGTSEEGGRYYSYLNNRISRGEYLIDNLLIDGVNINNYSIVYATEAEKEMAEDIHKAFGEIAGAYLEIKPTTYPETPNEILVGATTRAMSQKYISGEKATAPHNYTIAIDSGKLVVTAPNSIMMGFAIEHVCKTLLGTEKAQTLALTAENSVLGTTTAKNFDLVAKDAGDTRILSNNVYFEGQNAVRAQQFLDTIPLYDADILCLQEMDYKWHYLLDDNIAKLGYTAVPTKGTGEYANIGVKGNYTPIHYRADKFDLIDYGYQPYSSVKDNKQNIFVKYPELAALNEEQRSAVLAEYKGLQCVAHLSKSYTYAIFKNKTTGEQFAVISTHLTHDNSKTVANVRRSADLKELLAKVAELQTSYKNIPVVVMGDFNFSADGAPYKLLKGSLLTDAYYNAELTERSRTDHKLGQMPEGSYAPIDLCLHTSQVDANKLQIVINKYTIAYSDHIPVAFDFKLK